MAQADTSDWIEWTGGECPVDPHACVSVRFRDLDESSGCPASHWTYGDNWWKHRSSDHANDIIAYRVVQP